MLFDPEQAGSTAAIFADDISCNGGEAHGHAATYLAGSTDNASTARHELHSNERRSFCALSGSGTTDTSRIGRPHLLHAGL
jgi:hypothetical protein